MCGIAGVLGRGAGTGEPADQAARAMRAALSHRGPDGEGTWAAPSGEAVLVHTRLAVIDLSEAGRQPMVSDDGKRAAAPKRPARRQSKQVHAH